MATMSSSRAAVVDQAAAATGIGSAGYDGRASPGFSNSASGSSSSTSTATAPPATVLRQLSTGSTRSAQQHHLTVNIQSNAGPQQQQQHLWARNAGVGPGRLYAARGRPRLFASQSEADDPSRMTIRIGAAGVIVTGDGGGGGEDQFRSRSSDGVSTVAAGLAMHRRRRLILRTVNRSWPTSNAPLPTTGSAIRLDNGSSPAQSPRDVASMVRPSPVGALRRESFLYRSDSDFDVSPKSLSRASSLTANDACIDDMIVTPFAQILHCLRHIWSNYLLLTNIHPSKSRRALSKDKDHVNSINQINNLSDEQRQQLATETLEELEWCLDQLEATQTDRSVSDLATNKFKRMLSRELTQFAEASKSGNQISEYICHTFLEKEQEVDLPVFRVDHVDSVQTPASHSGDRSPRPGSVRSSSRSPCRPSNAVDRPPPPPTSAASRLVGSATTGGRRHQRLTNGSCSPLAGGPLPKYGVPTSDEEAMSMHMAGLNNWGIDVFHIAELTNNRPLCAMTYTILQERGLLKALHISPRTLINYISLIEDHYRPDVAYHNSIHAADVTQTSHVMLLAPALESVFTDLETLAVIFACAVHDVDHPGVSNQFLVQTGSELALIYNDESVLENHHLAVAFSLLQRDGCDLLGDAPRKQRQLFRRIVIDMVLATDMSRHMDHLAHLKTMVETRKISGNCEINMENYSDRIQVLQNLIHCADLSNPAKPLDLYRQWTDRITQEFFRQGDLERQLGIDISPMCDRQTASIDKTQVGFIDYIVQPLWETWSELVYPDCQDVLDALERNRSWYHEQIAASPPPTDVDSGHEGDGIDDDRGPDPLQVPSPDHVGYLRISSSRPITATPAAGR